MSIHPLTPAIETLTGALGTLSFRVTSRGVIIAARPGVKDPPTTDQLLAQSHLIAASRQWQRLTDPQRASWDRYAARYYKAKGVRRITGQSMFHKAAWYLQAIGGAFPKSAPRIAPPPPPTSITLLPTVSAQELAFTMVHNVPALRGHHIQVEITPAMQSPAQHPRVRDYRSIQRLTSFSFPVLQESGAEYRFVGIRFPLAKGERFGLRVRIISPAGVPGAVWEGCVVKR